MAYVYKSLFGLPRRPSLSQYVQMTDRADGTVWTLIHNVAEARVGISDVALAQRFAGQVKTFGPYDGPWVGNPPMRLFIRSGRLGYDDGTDDGYGVISTTVTDRDNPPVLTRIDMTSFHYEVYKPSVWTRMGDTLGYRDWSEGL